MYFNTHIVITMITEKEYGYTHEGSANSLIPGIFTSYLTYGWVFDQQVIFLTIKNENKTTTTTT